MTTGWWLARAALLTGVLACGCSSEDSSDAPKCDAKRATPALEPALHVADCSPVSHASNPPCSGAHYASWSAFGVYRAPLPRGFSVHALEHGAVVFSHHCDGCDDELKAAETLVSALVDPDCSASGAARVILTPDPLLDVPWAASAWGHTLRAECFDARVFESFFDERVGHGPEHVCAPGRELRLPDGSLDLPASCGGAP